MVESVALSSTQKLSILERTRIAELRDQASRRLATGRRVNDVSDDPQDYLRAQALANRVSGLLGAKSGIGQGIESLLTAQTGLEAVQKLSEQLKGIAISAQSASGTQLSGLVDQFDTVRQQLDNLAGDATYQGVNLLSNPTGTLRIGISDKAGETFTVNGQASDVTALSIGAAASDYNNFSTTANIESAIAALDDAISTIQSNEASIVNNAAILQVREDFTQDLADVLQSGREKLLTADLNAEGAKLMSAEVRDNLSVQGQKIAARSQSLIVDLLATG